MKQSIDTEDTAQARHRGPQDKPGQNRDLWDPQSLELVSVQSRKKPSLFSSKRKAAPDRRLVLQQKEEPASTLPSFKKEAISENIPASASAETPAAATEPTNASSFGKKAEKKEEPAAVFSKEPQPKGRHVLRSAKEAPVPSWNVKTGDIHRSSPVEEESQVLGEWILEHHQDLFLFAFPARQKEQFVYDVILPQAPKPAARSLSQPVDSASISFQETKQENSQSQTLPAPEESQKEAVSAQKSHEKRPFSFSAAAPSYVLLASTRPSESQTSNAFQAGPAALVFSEPETQKEEPVETARQEQAVSSWLKKIRAAFTPGPKEESNERTLPKTSETPVPQETAPEKTKSAPAGTIFKAQRNQEETKSNDLPETYVKDTAAQEEKEIPTVLAPATEETTREEARTAIQETSILEAAAKEEKEVPAAQSPAIKNPLQKEAEKEVILESSMEEVVEEEKESLPAQTSAAKKTTQKEATTTALEKPSIQEEAVEEEKKIPAVLAPAAKKTAVQKTSAQDAAIRKAKKNQNEASAWKAGKTQKSKKSRWQKPVSKTAKPSKKVSVSSLQASGTLPYVQLTSTALPTPNPAPSKKQEKEKKKTAVNSLAPMALALAKTIQSEAKKAISASGSTKKRPAWFQKLEQSPLWAIQLVLCLALLGLWYPSLRDSRISSQASANQVAQSLLDQVEAELYPQAQSVAFKRSFGLDPALYEDALFYRTSNALQAEELLLIRSENPDLLEKAVQAMKNRQASQYQVYESYAPKQAAQVKDALIDGQENYALYYVGSSPETIKAAFEQALKEDAS